ncbi:MULTISPECIES: autotransporter assembly complex family protein [unclassified Serratia (in: enterobacteria)]|uniref:autotransporter assembly complex protein TamA n=1 Tax=unclassified Serratia (in: enterobacteria) TaxID=2647522 RepID=UPI000506E238|nr:MULTISPECIES: autotransporter assembly complex family protein [unclassified Serratia (in: enterobacteria)]KFK92577.1 membrane protein [Serratia sp. Ag1]KFK96073.1 membrane protein [Serratia sp. Ag2]
MPRYLVLCILCALFAVPSVFAANLRLQVQGLSGDLERNVRARLSGITPEEVSAEGRFRARVDAAIRQGLRPLGYYEPTIDFTLDDRPTLSRPVLYAKVNPGEPVRIAGVNINLEGGARTDEDYLNLVKSSRPTLGEILNHGEYDSFKNSLTGLALRKGYFDANMAKSQLGVAQELHQAFWDIDFDSGDRYHFGKVKFQGSQIREDYLQNLVPFHQGDYYDSNDLAELNRRLSATNWFNSVVVSPDFHGANEHKILPLDALVTPRNSNIMELGGGFSTDIGPRVRGTWRKPWLNERGQSLTTSASISAPEQQLDLTYRIPLLKSPLEQYYLLQGGFKRTDLNDTKSDSTKMVVSRNWDLSSGWQRALTMSWRLDHFTQGLVTDTTMLLYPGATVNRTRARGGLMPVWGDSQRYSIDVSDTTWGSDVDFALLQAQNVWIRTLAEKHRFVTRAQVGWIETNNFDRIPPDLRFFAGGDRSIRGYKFQGVAPRDDSGKLTGASKMLTGSLEYQYNVTGRWWGAMFVDSGEAVNDIRQRDIKTGAGVGVRWQSPVGPVKLDIAAPIGDQDTHGIQFYIGLGPEL